MSRSVFWWRLKTCLQPKLFPMHFYMCFMTSELSESQQKGVLALIRSIRYMLGHIWEQFGGYRYPLPPENMFFVESAKKHVFMGSMTSELSKSEQNWVLPLLRSIRYMLGHIWEQLGGCPVDPPPKKKKSFWLSLPKKKCFQGGIGEVYIDLQPNCSQMWPHIYPMLLRRGRTHFCSHLHSLDMFLVESTKNMFPLVLKLLWLMIYPKVNNNEFYPF